MPPADMDQVLGHESVMPTQSFPEWTREDDNDIDIASIAERQRFRFRAASVAGRQRYQSPPRRIADALTHRDISHEAHQVRAILEGRRFGDLSKGLEAATSTLANGAGQAVEAVAEGIGNSGSAAASAFASGKGLGGAASAAAGSVANGFGKGANAAAGAVAGAGGAFASAVAGSGSDSSDDDKKTKSKPKKDPPPQTQEPPPPEKTNDPPPKVTQAPEPPSQPPPPKETQAPPPPPPPPPSSSSDKDHDSPKTTDKPIDNVPPPKAEQPSSKSPDDSPSSKSPSNDTPDTSSAPDSSEPPEVSPTSTDDDQKISLSTLIPGATVTSQSGTRLLLTPVLSSKIPSATSGGKKGTTDDFDSTTKPLAAIGPGPTTMMTSVSPTSEPRIGQSGQPSSGTNNKDHNNHGKDDSNGGGLSPSGQSALISIGVLVGVCALFVVGFYFWRRRKQQNNPTSGDGSSLNSRALFKSPLDKAKRGFSNVASRIPFLRDRFNNNNRWENIDDPYSDFFTEKRVVSDVPAMAAPPPPMKDRSTLEPITVQTTFTQRSSVVSQLNSTAAVGGTVSTVGLSTMGATAVGVSPITETSTRASAMGPSAVGVAAAASVPSNNNPLRMSPFEAPSNIPIKPPVKRPVHIASQARQLVGTNHGPKPSFSSTTPQYNLTLPTVTGAHRISDLSSLSSGFGDGDIVVPSKQMRKSTTSSKQPQNATTANAIGDSERNRNSSATTATAHSSDSLRRDTVYTEASEDSPPRFRTVNSWVRQQSGRVTREKQREEDAANESGTPPPVPAIPPEQEFRLMMPDGEEPRRVEDTNAESDDWGAQTKSMLNVVIGTAH